MISSIVSRTLRRARCVLALLCLSLTATASAQNHPATDPELARLIEQLTDRSSDGLVEEKMPSGVLITNLKGRFQNVPLAHFGSNGQAEVGCVTSLAEANAFFGRDLYTGSPIPKLTQSGEPLDKVAQRHGMSGAEFQFYSDLIANTDFGNRAKSATFIITNADSAGEGFNDPSPEFPGQPGNTGNANLGAQRLKLFQAAAQIWGNFLDSAPSIEVSSKFDPLTPCSAAGGVLGSAGAAFTTHDFPNAQFANTDYHLALANKEAGSDLGAGLQEINARFNSSVDTGCLGAGTHFYYGLDNATPAGTVNLFVVLLHELGHGLGFSNFALQTGVYGNGRPDIWSRFLFDATANKTWFAMTDAERATSTVNTHNLYWDGPNVRIASGFLTAGRQAGTGRVEMFTPNPFQGGSSVSHYSDAAFPDLLMEPAINTGLPLTLDLTRQQMRDIGWYRDTTNDLVPDTITNVLPSGGTVNVGSVTAITWTNNGGFARNVTIELSTDSGVTFPTAIATNITNTGSFAWTVPNTPTTTARLRVREHDFVAPLGSSAADFTIVVNTAPTFTPAAAITRQQGSNTSASTVGTVSDAQTPAGSLTVTQIAGGTAVGITTTGITNTSGTVSASLAASCTATAGTVRFQVSDGSLTGTGNLQVNINANTAPTLTYTNQSVAGNGSTTINPATGPSDNGSVSTVVVQSQGTYTGTISVNSSGVVSISNAAPIGTHTITIRATDNCATTTDATFQLQVNNTAPTFTPAAAITRQQGSPAGAAVTVGTVADGQTAAGSLTVTQVAGGTATGITTAGITNTTGTIGATLSASCTAVAGTVRFQVSDGSLAGTGDLQLNVNANTAPTLTYSNQSVAGNGSTTINPATGPSDNGSVPTIAVQSQGTYTGTISVNSSGVVSISNAAPIGTHTITIRATDNCLTTTDATFQLQVNNTAPTFTPAAAITRQQGSAAGAAVTVGTVADGQTAAGSLTVTQVAGGTASGITVGGITNTTGTVGATLSASCSAVAGTVRFQVSDGSLTGTGDLQLNVNANTAPTLTYSNQSVAGNGSTTINPATGPSDNGSVNTVALQSQGTYTGTISVDAAGVISISNAAPIGTHTITIRATDNCATTTDATFQLQVNNTAPTFTPAAAITRQQGSPAGAAVTVGTVADGQTAAGSLTVTQVVGGTANGITTAGITNTTGTIAATLSASCTAVAGTVRFQVSDGSLTGTGDLQLNVNANTAPTLTYTNQSVAGTASTTINPATGPSDNGSVPTIGVQSQGTYTGTISVNSSGVVSVSNAAPVGTHTITIRATDNCGANTDTTFQLQVTTATSSTALGSAPDPSNFGQSVTLTATVTGGLGTATGTVQFFDGATSLGSSALNGSGVATLSTSTLSIGNHNLSATYGGNSNYAGSTGNDTQTVNKAVSTTVLTSSPDPSSFGQTVTLTATVAGAVGTPTGSVQFFDGATSLGSGTLSGAGVASISASSLSIGNHNNLSANYGGDPVYATSTGNDTQTVNKAVSTTVLSSAPDPSSFGQSVTLTATVSGNVGTPTGSVQFFDGVTSLGSSAVNASGVATLSISTLSIGNHNSLAATYGGDSTYATSTGNDTQTVNKAVSTTTLTSAPDPSNFGQSVTLTATVTGGSGTPTGSVQFFDGVTSLGSVTLNGSGVATLSTSTLSIGNHNSLSVTYGGDPVYATSTGNDTQTVNKAVSTTTLTSAPDPSTLGQNVTLTATVTGAFATPTGSVEFFDGVVSMGTVSLNASGVATLSTTTLISGSHNLSAVYAGDAQYQGSTGNDTHVVGLSADLSVTKTNNRSSVVIGTSVSYDIIVSNAGPSTAVGAHVTDTPPATLTGVTWTCSSTPPALCPNASGSGPINETVTLALGQSVHYVLTGTVGGAVGGNLSNTALVSPPAGTADSNSTNDSATDNDPIVADGMFLDGFE